MVTQGGNRLGKTEHPELTLKLLRHSQILLRAPAPAPPGSNIARMWAGAGNRKWLLMCYTLNTRFRAVPLLLGVNSKFVSEAEVWRCCSRAFIRKCLLLSIHTGCKQFVCEAFWIYEMSGDRNLPPKLRSQLANAEILSCASWIMDGSGTGEWKVFCFF